MNIMLNVHFSQSYLIQSQNVTELNLVDDTASLVLVL